MQACLLNCLALPERTLRITAGTAVRFASPVRVPALLEVRLTCVAAASNIVIVGSLKAWPELCAVLPSMMDSPNVDASDGALDALFKVRCLMVVMQPITAVASPTAMLRFARRMPAAWTTTFRGYRRALRRCWCPGC